MTPPSSQDLLTYCAPRDLLQDRVILVTGAAQGIGRAVSLALATHGAQVIALDRKRRLLETLYDEITTSDSPEPVLVAQDLATLTPEQSEQIAAGVMQDCGRLDGLLHNAAALSILSPLHRVSWEQWQRVLTVNLNAPYLLTCALLPLLKQAKDAAILFTSAAVGRRARAYWGSYAVAYGGTERLMEMWAEELVHRQTIRINTLDPGPVRTALRNTAYPAEDKDNLLTPEQVTPAYLYLMGPDGVGVTGQALSIENTTA